MHNTLGVVPEQGQVVKVRGRHFLVQDTLAGDTRGEGRPMHRVRLECVDDDQLGEVIEVIWEHEVNSVVLEGLGLPRPEQWDPMQRFEAFLLASRWSLTSVVGGFPLQAPFRGAIQIEDYQLEPVVRALTMPRVNLLIADDVGLGKTIEAGMVVQEMLARGRVARILVVCPASLQKQWAEEMDQKFALHFEVVDRDYIHQMRREYGVHVNPWSSYPRLITSMDFLKREAPFSQFLGTISNSGEPGEPKGRTGLRDWDLLIIDECHNVAPSGRKEWVRDSERTHLVRQLMPHFENRLFLTATPHNGFTESFTALLEMLDPLRFSRCTEVNKTQLAQVMVRRIKDGMVDHLGRPRFPKRNVDALPVRLTADEKTLHELLDTYTETILNAAAGSPGAFFAVRFAATMLKKRLLSSVSAFSKSMAVHLGHLNTQVEDLDADDSGDKVKVIERLSKQLAEDYADDDEKDRVEELATSEAAGFITPEGTQRSIPERLRSIADKLSERPDSKLQELLAWIRKHLLTPEGNWTDQRLIVFTEYKHTLEYLHRHLEMLGWGPQLMLLYGGMPEKHRDEIKKAFNSAPGEHPVRILLATDAASEGLNLQKHCNNLIHYEIPWNPNKMEQRNGRIDRHGQPAPEVNCLHFAYEDRRDQDFLNVVVQKVKTQRADLGSVGEVIAIQVEEALLGRRKTIEDPQERRQRVQDELKSDLVTKDRIRQLRDAIDEARHEWKVDPDNLRLVLDEALKLLGHQGLVPQPVTDLAGPAFRLANAPQAWGGGQLLPKDSKGRLLPLVFDNELARGREDVALLHLDHPLMKRAIGVFRANLWSSGVHESHLLHRASYRVLPDREISAPVVVLVSRLVLVGQWGQKLHEQFIFTGGPLDKTELTLLDSTRLETIASRPGDHPPIPASLGDALRRYFPTHEKALEAQRDVQARELEADLKARLEQRARDEAQQVKDLIAERLREVTQKISEMKKKLASPNSYLPGFAPDELDQYEQDIRWLELRKDQLNQEKTSEPAAVKQRYNLRGGARCFPLALLYLIPKSYTQEVR